MTPRFLYPITLVTSLFCALPVVAAHADLTVVTDTTISGMPKLSGDAADVAPPGLVSNGLHETKTYYKGDKVRAERAGPTVIITDADGQTYTLNPTTKTYIVQTKGAGAPANPLLATLVFTAKMTVSPPTNHKSALGRDAVEYEYTGKIDITPPDPSIADMMPTITLTGQRWTTDSVKDAAAVTKATLALGTVAAGTMMSGGVEAVTKELSAIKGFPLEDSRTITMTFPDGSPIPGAIGLNPGATKISIKTTVVSVSEDPISDDLFTVPADYKKIDNPASAGPGAPGGNL